MKILFTTLTLLFVFLNASAETVDDKEQVFSLIGKLPRVTKAVIRRGKTEMPVDLSDASTRSKIKDYDVLLLDEGVYSNLGDFTAKYVRVIGKGLRKTFISSMAKDSAPINVNSTEFWDLTIADAQFRITETNGLWGINVELVGSILVRPSSPDKSAAFYIRTALSDLTYSDLPAEEDSLYAHFLSKRDGKTLMPIPSSLSRDTLKAEDILKYEDEFDRSRDMNLKNRIGYKGLFARGLNYLYQKEILKPQYDQEKFNLLAKNARSAKAKGHLYVSMVTWAEADRLSGHARFDDVLKEISPLSQNVSQDCGCTVEGQGLALRVKSEIEQKLYARLPVAALPGRCKIQTLNVNIPAGGNKEKLIADARLQSQLDQASAFRSRELNFRESVVAHSGGPKSAPAEEDFEVGAPAQMPGKDYTAVADVEMPGVKKSFSGDQKEVNANIIDPIAKLFTTKFAKSIKAAKAKIASSDLVAKVDGFIAHALYGDDPERQNEYEALHEQQFGRKQTASGAMSSAFAY